MKENRESLSLKYFGGTADTGEMDYYEAAGSIIAFGDLMGIVAENTYGGEAQIQTNVVGLKDNCFSIDFFVRFVAPLAATLPLSANLSPREVWNVVKQVFGIYRFLEGKPPEKVSFEDNEVAIINNHGKVIHTTKNVYNTIVLPITIDAVRGVFGAPLTSGHTKATIENQSAREVIEADESEAEYYKPTIDPNVISEQTVEIALVIDTLSFKKGNKWKFNDGQSTFYAKIEDENFLKRIENRERFAKGDTLRSKVTYRQVMRNGKLSMDHLLVRVVSHETPSEQHDLPGKFHEQEK